MPKKMTKKTVGIVGFGRFGQLLARLLETDFKVHIVEKNKKLQQEARTKDYSVMQLGSLHKVDVIFLAVPISTLSSVIEQLADIVQAHQTVMDVCSVKVYPAKLMERYLPHCQTLSTHPLFGPDSAREGLQGLKVVQCPINIDKETLAYWQTFWQHKEVTVLQTTPEAHDHDMVYSLALTQTLARMVGRMKLPDLTLTTKGFDAVKRVTDFSLNDTDELYHDMLYYNPYFQEMQGRFKRATDQTVENLEQIAEEQKRALRLVRR